MTVREAADRFGLNLSWLAAEMGLQSRQHLHVMIQRGLKDEQRRAIEETLRRVGRELAKVKIDD